MKLFAVVIETSNTFATILIGLTDAQAKDRDHLRDYLTDVIITDSGYVSAFKIVNIREFSLAPGKAVTLRIDYKQS